MTNGEPETSLQKIKLIKNPHFFIRSDTGDSFINHFDGHFAYLKTLDFYLNNQSNEEKKKKKKKKNESPTPF